MPKFAKVDYIRNVINKFSEKLMEKFGKPFKFYEHKISEGGFVNVMSAISSIEQIKIEDVYKLLEESAREIDNPEEYGFYFWECSREDAIDARFINVYTSDKPVVIRPSIYDKKIKVQAEDESEGIFMRIIRKALEMESSDIHIAAKESGYYIFFRVYGMYLEQKEFTFSLEKGLNFVNFLYAKTSEFTKGNFKPDLKLKHQDGRIDLNDMNPPMILRLSFVPSGWNENLIDVTIRLIKKELSIKGVDFSKPLAENLESFGILKDDIELWENILRLKGGLVVINGITNSGKSALVNTLLSSIKDKKIGTIEDPLEYFIPNANYIQHQLFVPPDENLKMSFEDYVKAFKRGDYDIIFVGEWRRDKGLTEALIEQAYAGQLVFTTLHIAESFQIFSALKDMYGVEESMLKNSLLLSWGQILLPKVCPHCSTVIEDYIIPREIIKNMEIKFEEEEVEKLIKARFPYVRQINTNGCEHCIKGVVGRTPIYDYFINKSTLERTDSYYIKVKSDTVKKTKVDVFIEKFNQGLVDINSIYLL